MKDEENEQLARIEEVLRGFVEEGSDFTLDLQEWKFKIRIKGPKWQGVVDKPIADFVIDLDKRLRAELAKQGIAIPKSEHGLVALRIDEGSTLAFLEGVPETLEQIRKFPPEQQMLVFIAILVAAGVWGAVKVTEIKAGKTAEEEKTKREQIRATERLDTIKAMTDDNSRRELEKPLRGLVRKLGDGDKIELPARSEPKTKKEATKELFVASERAKTKNYYIDQIYVVEELSTKTPGKWTMGLRYGDLSFRAKVMLQETDLQELLKSFRKAHAKGSEISPELQVTADVNRKGVRTAEVIGMGPPRNKNTGLAEALKKEGFVTE